MSGEEEETESEDRVTDSIKETGDEDHINALRVAIEDARRTHDEHIAVFNDEAAKAGRLAQFNGVILTLVITVERKADSATTIHWSNPEYGRFFEPLDSYMKIPHFQIPHLW